jgi:magnesium chelatase subunit D
MNNPERRVYPFPAIIGQEKLKTAYLANVVNPRIGGLLISGPKGTGKSTAVHSIAAVLPEYRAVQDCPFNCDPADPSGYCTLCRERTGHQSLSRPMRIINLPLSCSEDRLVGSIDVEKLLKTGAKEVLPGILGAANGNILYVDEVNLLPDHLVDDILDAAASHWNTIEREGVSVSHPADFVLVGTMNPEEGDLRPQILDRFPLCVRIETVGDPELRVEIVRSNLLFEDHPDKFFQKYDPQSEALKTAIVTARDLLPRVTASDEAVAAVARACAELKVDGQRPDVVIVKTAITLAALNGRIQISREDLLLAAELALTHRTRDGGLLEPPSPEEIARIFGKHSSEVPAAKELADSNNPQSSGQPSSEAGSSVPDVKKKQIKAKQKFIQPAKVYLPQGKADRNLLRNLFNRIKRRFTKPKTSIAYSSGQPVPLFDPSRSLTARLKGGFLKFLKKIGKTRSRSFKGSPRRRTVVTERSGRNVKPVSYQPGENTLAPVQTMIRAAGQGRYELRSKQFSIGSRDLMGWEKSERQSLTLVLLADVSHSTHPYINVMAEIINSLTGYFRMHKDRIGLISLAGAQARILNHPTHNYRVVTKSLMSLAIHGQTPLADGMQKALAMIRLQKHRTPGSASLVIALTDCFPEPLTHRFPDPFDEPAYRETVRAAKLFKKDKVPLLLINPSFKHEDEKDYFPGERLSAAIERDSGGRLIKLYQPVELAQTQPGQGIAPSQRDILRIISGVEEMLGERKLGEERRMAG